LFGLIVKIVLRVGADRATGSDAGPGDLPGFLSLPAAGALTPQCGEVGFERAILLDQFALTSLVPPPPFGLFDGSAYGAAHIRPTDAALFEAVMRATLHRLDRK